MIIPARREPCPAATIASRSTLASFHSEKTMLVPKISFAAIALVTPLAASAVTCDQVIQALGTQISSPICFHSSDLTTANPLTTPADIGSLTTFADGVTPLPQGGFTPTTDRGVISPALKANQTPITKAVPGVQLDAWIAGDPTGQARFLIRLPDDWNGKLVVAGASGTRSEFNGDFAWSDYVVQKGYAYASQNKGVLNLFITTSADPLGCRLNPASTLFVHFFDNDPGQEFGRWTQFMNLAARVARRGVERHYDREPARTYAVGTSNGGYQVRRAL